MNPYEYDLIKKEAPFIKDPHSFVYWGNYRLRPVVATSVAQRKLFKENGWIWDRNSWRKPDAAEISK